jgi:hypothetical protein
MREASHEARIKQSGIAAAVPIVSAIGSVLGGIGALTRETPSPPPIAKPVVMPTPDDEVVKRAKRRSLATQQGRSGRISTILSEDEALGG